MIVCACAYVRACGYACMFVCEHVCVCVSACAFVCVHVLYFMGQVSVFHVFYGFQENI